MSLSKHSSAKYLLILICAFFLFTRLYRISEIPPSVYWDEASIGYNAYSIAQTGRDEWGKFLPIHFRAFGEFKLPIYIYTTALSVKIFGLNEFSLRIPAILFSLGVVVLTYLLAKRLSVSKTVGIFAAFFITISPWFFIFSRTGYEVTAGLMFYLLAVFLFLQNENDGKFILLSSLSFIASAYSYNSFRVVAPLTLLILTIFEKDNLKQIFKLHKFYILMSAIFLILAAIPIARLYLYDAGSFRFQAVGNTSGSSVIYNYLSHFNPHFLFINGDNNLRSQQANFGQTYFPDLILITVGLLYLITSKSKNGLLTLLLLLIGPIPAALTKESPHALRALSVVPFYAILLAQGVAYIKKFLHVRYFEIFLVIIFLSFFSYYLVNFINVYPIFSSKDWQYGYKRIFLDYQNKFSKFDKVVISDAYAQPYIFALFYLKYGPENFRREVVRNSVNQWGFSTVGSFNNFLFTHIKFEKLPKGKLLIFASSDEKLDNVGEKSIIRNLDGTIAFYIYEYTKP